MVLEPIITKAVISNSVKLIEKKMPLILMGAGLGLSTGSTILAVKATPEATAAIKQIKRTPDLTPSERNWEIFKRVVPLYAPAALAAVGGAACIISSYSINVARLAELGAAYAVAQNSLTTYRKEVEQKYGKEVEKELVEKTVKREEEREKEADMVDEFARENTLELDGGDKIILVDRNTGRPYLTTPEDISDVCLSLQHDMTCGEMSIDYSEFETGLAPTKQPCNFSSDHGWIAGDIIKPWFSDWYITKKGNKYKEFEIDTNPRFLNGGRKLGDIL